MTNVLTLDKQVTVIGSLTEASPWTVAQLVQVATA